MEELPIDIRERVKQDFGHDAEVQKMIDFVRKDNLNVGVDQLLRSILIIAKGDKNKLKEIIDTRYHGDPRDVIMMGMGVSDHKSNYGMKPFDESD